MHVRPTIVAGLPAVVTALLVVAVAAAPIDGPPPAFSRVIVVEGTPGEMVVENPVRILEESEHETTIMLVSMVHVAETSFYASLGPTLAAADLILYEGTLPDDAMRDDEAGHFAADRRLLKGFQEALATLGALTSQRAWQIPLMRDDPRWISIDLSPDELRTHVEAHGIRLVTPAFGQYARRVIALAESLETAPPDVRRRVRHQIRGQALASARTISPDDCCFGWLDDADRGVVHTFVHDRRNAHFIAEMRRHVRENPGRRIVVLLGDRHMPTLERNLSRHLDMHHLGTSWHESLRVATADPTDEPALQPETQPETPGP